MAAELMNELRCVDPEVYRAIVDEVGRVEGGLELIPSENFVSRAVMQAMSSVFTNKYSEGYPGKRYYGGQENVDVVEGLAVARAKALFGAEHVNVQPYSGSPANQAVFYALMEPGGCFMGLDLGCGGHLTHGSPVNFSGRYYRAAPYYVDRDTGLLDMDQIRRQAERVRPRMIIASLTSYPRRLDFEEFHEICKDVGAYSFADISHIAGLVVGGVHPSPLPFMDVVTTTTHKSLRGPRGAVIMCRVEDRLREVYHPGSGRSLAELIDGAVFPGLQGGPHDNVTAAKAVAFLEASQPGFREYARQVVRNAGALAEELMGRGLSLVTGGTDNHLMVVDLRPLGLGGRGRQVQAALDRAGLTVNRNSVPFDEAGPFNPSGIRLGTPAVTTRGMREPEMRVIGEMVAEAVAGYRDREVLGKVREGVRELVAGFPVYPGLTVLG